MPLLVKLDVTSVVLFKILTVPPVSTPVSVNTFALTPVPCVSVGFVGAVVSILPVTADDAADVAPFTVTFAVRLKFYKPLNALLLAVNVCVAPDPPFVKLEVTFVDPFQIETVPLLAMPDTVKVFAVDTVVP